MKILLGARHGMLWALLMFLLLQTLCCNSVEKLDYRENLTTLHSEDTEPLLLKALRIVLLNGQLYVLDKDDWNIKVFTQSGDCRRIIPISRGQGPDEVTTLTGLCEDQGRLYVGGLKKLLEYDVRGTFLRTIELPVPIISGFTVYAGQLYTAALGNRENKATTDPVAPQQPFRRVDLNSGQVECFGQIDYLPGPQMEEQLYFRFGKSSQGIIINAWFLPVAYVYRPQSLESGKKYMINNGTDYGVWSNFIEGPLGNLYVMGLNRLTRTADLICLDKEFRSGFLQQFQGQDFSESIAMAEDLSVYLLSNQGTELKRSVVSPMCFRNASGSDFQHFLSAQVKAVSSPYRDVREVARGYIQAVETLGLKANPMDSALESIRCVWFSPTRMVLNSGESRLNLLRWNEDGFQVMFNDERPSPFHNKMRAFLIDSGWVVICKTYRKDDSHTVQFLNPDGRRKQEKGYPWKQCPIGVTDDGNIVIYHQSTGELILPDPSGDTVKISLSKVFPSDTRVMTSDLSFFQDGSSFLLWNGDVDTGVWIDPLGHSRETIDIDNLVQTNRSSRDSFRVIDVNFHNKTLWVLTRYRKSKSSYTQLELFAVPFPFSVAESQFCCRVPGYVSARVNNSGSILLMPWGREAMYLVEREK